MYQNIILDRPIPSCELAGLQYGEDEQKRPAWKYVYALNTPEELTDENETQDFMVYEYICDLVVRYGHKAHEDAVNIHFKTLSQYMRLLERQAEADERFRQEWMEKSGKTWDDVPEHAKRLLEHRDYTIAELVALKIHFLSRYAGEVDGKSLFFAR